MNQFREKYGEWAIVTGASAGIGLALSEQLAEKGLNLVLIARGEEKLLEAKKKIENRYSVQTKTIALDVTSDDAIKMIEEQIQGFDIGLIVPNAGIENSGHFLKTSLPEHERLLKLNVEAPLKLVHYFGKNLIAKGRGGIIFVSSLMGYQGVPYLSNYSASKSYILSLGEALSEELREFNIDVLVLSPGLTQTEMPEKMPLDWSKMPITKSSSSSVARVALNSIGKKATVVPGFLNKFYAWENRLIPRTFPVKLFGFLIKRAFKRDRKPDYFLTSRIAS